MKTISSRIEKVSGYNKMQLNVSLYTIGCVKNCHCTYKHADILFTIKVVKKFFTIKEDIDNKNGVYTKNY